MSGYFGHGFGHLIENPDTLSICPDTPDDMASDIRSTIRLLRVYVRIFRSQPHVALKFSLMGHPNSNKIKKTSMLPTKSRRLACLFIKKTLKCLIFGRNFKSKGRHMWSRITATCMPREHVKSTAAHLNMQIILGDHVTCFEPRTNQRADPNWTCGPLGSSIPRRNMLKRVGVRASPIVFKFYCLLTSQTAMEKKKSPSSRVPHFYFQKKLFE